jgi:hypothetical protein
MHKYIVSYSSIIESESPEEAAWNILQGLRSEEIDLDVLEAGSLRSHGTFSSVDLEECDDS